MPGWLEGGCWDGYEAMPSELNAYLFLQLKIPVGRRLRLAWRRGQLRLGLQGRVAPVKAKRWDAMILESSETTGWLCRCFTVASVSGGIVQILWAPLMTSGRSSATGPEQTHRCFDEFILASAWYSSRPPACRDQN